MVTTLMSQPTVGRARSVESLMTAVAPTTCAASFASAPMFHAPFNTTTNMWLGGAVQGSGSGSKYAIKRIPPGRLRTET